MFLIDGILAILLAIVLGLLLTGVFGWRHPACPSSWPGLLFLFGILFLSTWAGGAWIVPIGPTLWGARWLSFVIVGLFMALLLLALSIPVRPPRTRSEALEQAKDAGTASAVLGIGFWALLIALGICILARYMAVR